MDRLQYYLLFRNFEKREHLIKRQEYKQLLRKTSSKAWKFRIDL